MKNLKVKERRTWSWEDVRSLCIRNEWYEYGDCQDYMDMLHIVEHNKPTINNLYKVALDIYEHSYMSRNTDYSLEENLENIMFQLEEDTVHTFFEIEKEV